MTAVLVPTASEAEWLEARRQGVTASEIAVLMGLSPYSSPYALYHQKLGILPSQDDSPEMERGRVLEPYVAEKFAAAHPDLIVAGTGRELFAHPDRPWQMATPDRFLAEIVCGSCGQPGCPYTSEPLGLLECKVDGGSDEWGDEGTDEIPVHYRAQAIWQMEVMDVSRVYVDCLDPGRWRIRSYVIEANEGTRDDLALMLDAARDFLDRVDREEAPDVDWRPATIGALKQLHPSVTDEDTIVGDRLARNWRAAIRNEKHWERRRRLYEARIREQMGSAKRAFTAIGSEPVCRRDVYEVREHVRKASVTDKLVPVNPKKEKTS